MDKFDPNLHDDNAPRDVAFLAGMKPSKRGRPKLDAPTASHLRKSGPGWQTRVNDVLG